MQIYPAIDIRNGKCVITDYQGNTNAVYSDDPIAVAEKWVSTGAKQLHIIDLDGAVRGCSYNTHIIKEVLKTFSVSVQAGGGIRSMRDIEKAITWGAARVVIATAAVMNPELVREAVKYYGDKIVVAIDAMNGRAAIQGWQSVSAENIVRLFRRMVDYGVKNFIYTDISRNCTLQGPDVDFIATIVDISGVNMIVSGGIASMMDLENLDKVGVPGVIINKAIYQGNINLTEAISRFEKNQAK